MYHGVSFRLLHNPPLQEITQLFTRLKQDGCDAIAIIPHHYVSLEPGTANLAPPPPEYPIPWFIYPDVGQDPTHPYHNTPEPELVLATCRLANQLGMRVLLKPHIDSYAADWRGFISVQDRVTDWAWSYRQHFLARYLDIARQVDGTILSLGCELYTVTKELGAEFWIGLAAWVRQQGFTGPLTYAANWGWADDAEYNRLSTLWPHLDYIGVDGYFPLVPLGYSGALDVNTLAAAWHRRGIEADWCPRIDDDLLALSKRAGRPLLFTEIGYPNHSQAAENPGRDPLSSDVRDDDLQRRLALAFQQRWADVKDMVGTFWWEARLDQTNKAAISHDIIGQPIEQIVFRTSATSSGVPLPTLAPPTTDPARALAIHGLHGPNSRLADFHSTPDGPAEGADAVWERVQLAGGHWLKLIYPDHSRADAEAAKARGLHVLVRAPGVGIVHWEAVQQMITEFRGVCDIIEVGNEPFPADDHYANWADLLWNHAWFLEAVWQHCASAAHEAGIQLCAPGWRFPLEPPVAGTRLAGVPELGIPDMVLGEDLARRLQEVYSAYDMVAVHCYDAADLNHDGVFDRIARWHQVFGKPIYLTEYGIAFRHLPGVPAELSDLLKARRYAQFVQRLATLEYVHAAFIFILGGTNDFAAFNGPGYDPNGPNSYWISKDAYALLGQTLAAGVGPTVAAPEGIALAATLEAAMVGHIAWGDRPHGPDFPIMSTPTISPAIFAAWLQTRHSPALNEADAIVYYHAVLNRGINPALALAFFHHESQCGTDPDGAAVRYHTRNWGNLRPRSNGSLGRAIGTTPMTQWGIFRVYRTYLDSLLDWCDLWFLPLYQGLTIRQALAHYAPSDDGNDPNNYANTVLRLLTQWDQASGEFDLPGAAPIPPTDYPLLAPASISKERFRDTLVAAASPILADADSLDYYQLCTANGVDPAIALAFFGQETAYGTQDGAIANKNWANLWDAAGHRTAVFPSWLAGLRALCARWQTAPFADGGPPTVRRIVPLHRGPRPDNPQYLSNLMARIALLQAVAPQLTAEELAGIREDFADEPADVSTNGKAPALDGQIATLGGAAPPNTGRSQLAEWVGTWNKDLQRSVNFDAERNGHQPIAIVNHVMIGTMEGTADAFSQAGTRASAHYGVGTQGRIVQFVNEHDTAWANGRLYDPNVGGLPWLVGVRDHGGDPNNYTISIEWEGTHKGTWIDWQGEHNATLQHGSVSQWWVPGEAQYQAGLALIRDLCARYNIALDGDQATLRAHICRHSDFDNGKKWFCPGEGFPMARLLNDLRSNSLTSVPLLAPASITWERFRDTLVAAASPALAEADSVDYYQICTANGVDPAVALAFFGQETAYGTQDGAIGNKNWANLWDAAAHRTAVFPTWLTGLRALCTRWKAPPFTDDGPPTITSIIPRHRGNRADNPAYLSDISDRIALLRGTTPPTVSSDEGIATPLWTEPALVGMNGR